MADHTGTLAKPMDARPEATPNPSATATAPEPHTSKIMPRSAALRHSSREGMGEPRRREITNKMAPAPRKRMPASMKAGKLSSAKRLPRYVVPQKNATET